MTASDDIEPVDIRYDNGNQRLEVTWSDDRETVYGYEFLRWNCRCAACIGEGGYKGMLAEITELRPEQFRAITAMELVGSYGIRPTWSDGHNTGIYMFDRLRTLSDPDHPSGRPANAGGTRAGCPLWREGAHVKQIRRKVGAGTQEPPISGNQACVRDHGGSET